MSEFLQIYRGELFMIVVFLVMTLIATLVYVSGMLLEKRFVDRNDGYRDLNARILKQSKMLHFAKILHGLKLNDLIPVFVAVIGIVVVLVLMMLGLWPKEWMLG